MENENLCAGCENNCCDNFRLYMPAEEIEELIKEYPFLSVVGKGLGFVGSREAVYRVMSCERLNEDGSCQDYPQNRPDFCGTTGVETRPAKNCRLNDAVRKTYDGNE